MDAFAAHHVLERERRVHDAFGLRVAVVGIAELRVVAKRHLEVGQGLVLIGPAVDALGNELRDLVRDRIRVAEHAAGVADGRARLHRRVRDDLRDAVLAVLLPHVLDHFESPLVVEVDVDIGHLGALGVEEPLEQQTVLERVEVGDAERVADDRPGRRAAARTDADAVVLRPPHEVRDDEEVRRKALGGDDLELGVEPLERPGRYGRAVAVRESYHAFVAQVFVLGAALGRLEYREDYLVELEFDLALGGDVDRVGERLGIVAERCGHLVVALQVELVGGEPHAARVIDRRAGADAQQEVLSRGVLGHHVVDVVGADEAHAHLGGHLRDLGVELLLRHAVVRRDALLLDLEVEVVAEQAGVGFGPSPRRGEVALLDRLAHDAAHACRGAHEAFVMLLEQRQVDARLVVEPARGRLAHDRHEVAVARLVLREQQQVEQRRLALAPGARLRREVRLTPDDRLDPALLGCAVELDGAVHGAVVGERDGVLSDLGGAGYQTGDAGMPVEERVLRVRVQVDEAGHAQASPPGASPLAPRRSMTVRYPSAP